MARGVFAGIVTGIVVSVVGAGVMSLAVGPVAPVAPVTGTEPAADTDGATGGAADAVDATSATVAANEAKTDEAPTVPAADAVDAMVGAADAADATSAAPPPDEAEADEAVTVPADTTGMIYVPKVDLGPTPGEPAANDTAAADTAADNAAADATAQMASEPQSATADMAQGGGAIGEDTPPAEPAAPDSEPGAADGTATPKTMATAEPEPQPAQSVAPEASADRAEPAAEAGAPVSQTEKPSLIVVEHGAEGDSALDVMPDDTPLALNDQTAPVFAGRLPMSGDAAAESAATPAPEPALLRNAIAYTGGSDQPMLSFLLLDTGQDRAALGDLDKLPFPVTVAVDASAPDAAAAMTFYHDHGAEVALVVPLPDGATPSDVDVTMEAYAPLLDKAVAVVTQADLPFQTLGDTAVELATNLAEDGLGLVSYPAGLNTGHKEAVKQGVKAAMVFRDLDSKGQDGAVIRRFLDNAAFRARNEGGVIVVGRTRPETLQAMLEWSLGTRAQTVALAPLSALLEAE